MIIRKYVPKLLKASATRREKSIGVSFMSVSFSVRELEVLRVSSERARSWGGSFGSDEPSYFQTKPNLMYIKQYKFNVSKFSDICTHLLYTHISLLLTPNLRSGNYKLLSLCEVVILEEDVANRQSRLANR